MCIQHHHPASLCYCSLSYFAFQGFDRYWVRPKFLTTDDHLNFGFVSVTYKHSDVSSSTQGPIGLAGLGEDPCSEGPGWF